MNSSMFYRTGSTGVGFYFFPNRVEIYDNVFLSPIKTVYLDATVYHKYKIVKENNFATLYIDGENVGEFRLRSGSGYNQYRFFFGDGTSDSASSETYYKDIKIAPGKVLH